MTGDHLRALPALAVVAAYALVFVPLRTPAVVARLRAGVAADPGERQRFYTSYIGSAPVSLGVAALAVWLGGDGPRDTGVWWPPVPSLVVAVVLGGAAYLLLAALTDWYARGHDPAALTREAQLGYIEFLIPRTRRERDTWPLLCLVVALVEEGLYRGLLTLYAAHLAGVSPWWLVPPVTAAFAVSHRYQGWYGATLSGALGLSLAVVTVRSGSVWPAVVAHFLVDLRVLWLRPPAPAPSGPATASAPPQAPPA